jgi:outer membrane receptor protein involved in Fe transport
MMRSSATPGHGIAMDRRSVESQSLLGHFLRLEIFSPVGVGGAQALSLVLSRRAPAIVPRPRGEQDMRRNITRGHRRSPVYTALIVALMGCPAAWPALAQTVPPADARASIDIPAGDLAGALDRLSAQTGLAFMYQPDLVAGKQARAFAGQLTWQEALRRLLDGSGLQYRQINATTVVIRPMDGSPQPRGRPAAPPKPVADDRQPVTDMQAVMVTGTRIRGGTTPSPVITIGSEQIREEGFTDLGEVIRNVTENFRGGQNPGIVNGSQSNMANQNISGGSGLNLRGLGPDASLTLLNGKRMAYDGFGQAVDISAIPVEAVERIEIVADGASAIYGSDAVAGVGNVILKRDFDGVTLGTRYGAATDGGMATREVTATGGTTWSTGGLIATYKQSSADPIYADQRDYTEHLVKPFTIYPKIELKSALLSAHQSIGDSVEFRLDAFKTDRDYTSKRGVASANFYYLYPLQSRTFFVSPGLEISLPADWSMSIYATTGRSNVFYGNTQVDKNTGQALTPSRICYCNKSRSYEASMEGPLFQLSGGDARIAMGAGYRVNDYLYRSGKGVTLYGGDESSRFAYVELNLPLIGEDSKTSGVRRLELTAAARTERYSSFGGVTTPKLGVIYGLNGDITFKASWGKSFKAPTLQNQNGIQQAILYPVSSVGGSGYPADSTAIFIAGGNPALKPERARSWTTSVVFHPQSLPNMEAELTWFDINYTNRVVSPIPFANSTQALSNPLFADFVEYNPTVEEQEEILATPLSGNQFYDFSGTGYDPHKVVAIVNDLDTNATGQKIRGLDLSASYRIDLVEGGLTFRGSASWLDSAQRTTPAQQPYDLSGTLFNPARLNGRMGAIWSRGAFTTSLFATYTGGVTDTVASRKSSSFTTFDSVLRYSTGEDGIGSGMDFALSVRNILDRKPPLYPTASVTQPPFDSTNYSAIGRFVSVSVSKHW